METSIVNRIRISLVEKRDNLTAWLHTTPPKKRQIALGTESEGKVYAHLGKLEDAIGKSKLETFGVCEECGESIKEERLEMDYTSCVCLDHLTPKEASDLEQELELAQDVQRSLLPQQDADIPGLEVVAFSHPAQIVSGDYFDYFEYQNGVSGIAIADVAGHGVSASLLMASVQTLLRVLVPMNNSPMDVIKEMNHLYQHNIRFTTFVTVFIGLFNPENHTFSYCNAGHNPPIVLRKASDEGSEVLWLKPTGPAIGLVDDANFSEGKVELLPGDLLTMYTDGLTEAINSVNEEFGQDRLASLIQEHRNLPVDEIIREIRVALGEFTEGKPLSDDTTIVICRIGKT